MSNCKKILNLKTQKGFSLLEIMVAVGLLALISLGIATIMQNMATEQKKFVLMNALREVKSRIENNIRDQNSWIKTINSASNPSLNCLKTSMPCTVQDPTLGLPTKIILKDAADNTTFDLLDWQANTGNGFTESGGSCNNFNAIAGNGVDSCPFSYRLVQVMTCTGAAATCSNPQIKVTARLIFNPSTNGVLNKFKNLIAIGNLSKTTAGTGTDGADSTYNAVGPAVDDQKYDVAVFRTASQLNRNFTIGMTFTGGFVQDCTSSGAGICTLASTVHPLSWDPGVTIDPYSMITFPLPNQLSFNETGWYSCTIGVTAFATTGFTATFVNTTTSTDVGSANTIAGYWSQSSAIIQTQFNVTSTTDVYQIFQRCDIQPTAVLPGDINVKKCSLGMATNFPYTAANKVTVVSMTCFRLDKGF